METGTVFSGNYTAYSDKKAMLRDARIRAYLNQQQGNQAPGGRHCQA